MKFLSRLIYALHGVIGISAPPEDKVVLVAAIWLGSGLFILLVVLIMYLYVF